MGLILTGKPMPFFFQSLHRCHRQYHLTPSFLHAQPKLQFQSCIRPTCRLHGCQQFRLPPCWVSSVATCHKLQLFFLHSAITIHSTLHLSYVLIYSGSFILDSFIPDSFITDPVHLCTSALSAIPIASLHLRSVSNSDCPIPIAQIVRNKPRSFSGIPSQR